jgi:hypothetical protein
MGRNRPHLAGEVVIVLILVKVYDFVGSLAAPRQSEAVSYGRDILLLEMHLHLDVERTLNGWLSASSPATDLAAGWYQFMHLTVTLSVLAACYYRRPDIYRRARNSLVVVNLTGLFVFWLYPVAPPRLLPGLGFTDSSVVARLAQTPAASISADMFAALPSLHMAWATWTVIMLRYLLPEHSLARRLAPAYAGVTALVVLATGNHYVLDVVAGIAVCLAASVATGLIGPGAEALAEPQDVEKALDAR